MSFSEFLCGWFGHIFRSLSLAEYDVRCVRCKKSIEQIMKEKLDR